MARPLLIAAQLFTHIQQTAKECLHKAERRRGVDICASVTDLAAGVAVDDISLVFELKVVLPEVRRLNQKGVDSPGIVEIIGMVKAHKHIHGREGSIALTP